jgi:hypothetical protein
LISLDKVANSLDFILLLKPLATITFITARYQTLADLRWKSAAGISLLLALCLAAGWIFGGGTRATRRAVALTPPPGTLESRW